MGPSIIILAAAGGCAAAAGTFFGLRRLLWGMIDRRIANFQSSLIEKQILETENMYRQMRGWRHDYRNHIQNMKILLAQGNYRELDGYMDGLARDLVEVDTVLRSGNVMADAVLNVKLSLADKQGIRVSVKANIPGGIRLSDVELCAVLGNLLDNALEGCARAGGDERFIRVFVGTIKGQFYMSVQNSSGEIRKAGGGYLSTKREGNEQGLGLFRIDRIARKYGGCVNRQSEPGVFATELTFPLENGENAVGAR